MRYYEVDQPGQPTACTTNVRRLRELPEGTKVWRIITDRDGTRLEQDEIPVLAGRVQIHRRAVRNVKMSYQKTAATPEARPCRR